MAEREGCSFHLHATAKPLTLADFILKSKHFWKMLYFTQHVKILLRYEKSF